MSFISYSKNGPVAQLTLNRPDKLNAVHPDMVRDLQTAFDQAEADPDIRVILLNGAGRAFSAGFDNNATEQRGDETMDEAIRREIVDIYDLILRIWDCPKPTIAAVHGYCLGSSLELCAVCDMTISSQDCRFGEPEVTFGSGIVFLILPWILGFKHANEILLLGRKDIDANRAFDIGLVNRVVDNDKLMDEALSVANELAANDAYAVAGTRRAIRRTLDHAGFRDAISEALEIDVGIEITNQE